MYGGNNTHFKNTGRGEDKAKGYHSLINTVSSMFKKTE